MRGWRSGLTAALAALALTAATVGCGDSEDDSSKGSATAASATKEAQGASLDSPEAKAAVAVLQQMADSWNAKNGAGYCSALTAEARDDAIRSVYQSNVKFKSRECPALLGEFSRFMAKANPELLNVPPVKAKSVKVDGNNAQVTFTGGMAGKGSLTYPLTQTGGEWKVASLTGASRE